MMIFLVTNQLTPSDKVPYGLIEPQLAKHNIKWAKVNSTHILGEFKALDPLPDDLKARHTLKFSALRPTPLDSDKNIVEKLAAELGPDYDNERETGPWIGPFLYMMLPTLVVLAIIFFILLPRMRDPLGGGFLSNYVKSPAKRYDKGKGRVTFDDVADMENAKSELVEIVDFLKNPEKFQRLGGQIPKGVLLVGPPGNGKTLLARAIAGEAGVPFFSINGSEFIQMFVGVGASVTGDTPVLVRRAGRTELLPIAEVVNAYYQEGQHGFMVHTPGLETLGFEEKDSKFKGSSKVFIQGSAWKKVRGVYRHRVAEIYEIRYLGGTVRTTGDHSLFVRTRDGIKAVAARELQAGDVLVQLPVKVRGEYARETGTPHTVRGHAFPPLTEPLFLEVTERDPVTEGHHVFALAQRGVMSQRDIADQIGVSQMTVSNWQRGKHLPRTLSPNYTETVLPERVQVTPELMRLLGYYVAEGRDNGCVQLVFNTNETAFHADCLDLFRRLFGVEAVAEPTPDNATRITAYSAPLGRFFARHCGTGCRNKHIPEFLWDLPLEYFRAFLEGYARGDGYEDANGRLSVTSVSQQLIRELAWLCAMHGIPTGIRHWKQQGGRVIKTKPLPDGEAWSLIIGKTSNPLAPAVAHPTQGKKPVVQEIVVRPFDGYVYDLCGCENEAFFGGDKPILLHNSRVRDLFKTARENAPCILFVDEIDAVGRVRGAGLGGGHDEREQTLNQILSEMDGFLPTESVIVIAATNRPDVLDPALLRPGRFDRHVTVDRPTWQGRLAILKVHTRDKPLANDVDLTAIAKAMIGMTGADLRNLANEAALLATRENKPKIERRDFERAADRVLIGAKREEVLSPEDKRKTAYHEAGHALVAWLEPAADRPLKVSIIPRGRTLGVNINIPEEERYHYGLDFYRSQLVFAMGGRAADKLVLGQPYSGEEGDLKQATRIARLMVTHWGMSDRLGPVAYRIGEEHVFLGKEIHEPRDFSEGTAQVIDEEVRRILHEAEERAIEHLRTHRAELDRIVEALLQKEELNRDEIDRLVRGEPLPPEAPPEGVKPAATAVP
jgi:ATP-dependent metalloprotease FtsH